MKLEMTPQPHRASRLSLNQVAELSDSIFRKHKVPHKFAYLNSGAKAWGTISNDPKYDLGRREISSLMKLLSLARSRLNKTTVNILHVGSGNGAEIEKVVDILGVRRIGRYGLIDFSPTLLREAEVYGRNHCKGIKFLSFVHDITQPGIADIAAAIRQNETGRNLFLLIANGAILSDLSVLSHIRHAMTPKDQLLITLEVYSPRRKKEILDQYKLPSIINLFTNSLRLVGIDGCTQEHFQFEYDPKRSMVEVFFLTRKWLASRACEKPTINLSLPETIKVFSTLRPTLPKLRNILGSKGYAVDLLRFFPKENCCGVLCSVSRKSSCIQARN